MSTHTTRGFVCTVCTSLNPNANTSCGSCGFDPSTDGIFEELLRLDQDKSIRVIFDPLPHDGASVDKMVDGHVYRIIRLR